jgi:FtsP/CotA-like multicopper oxidase with cupredoxin domain
LELNRRNFLIGTGVVAGTSFLSPFGIESLADSAFASGSIFSEPARIISVNGHLKLNLIASEMLVPFDGAKRWALTYNKSLPGPTLVAYPGDTLNINLKNATSLPTNLHTHGLHVSPAKNGDNPLVEIMPGANFQYEIKIPKNHQSGTFWYHPHHHKFTAQQLSAGLAGAIIIEDKIDAQKAFTSTTDRIMMFADPRIGPDQNVIITSMMDQAHGRSGPFVLINGLLNPRMESKFSQPERWRIINACPSRYLNLQVENADLLLIATDGGRLNSPVRISSLLVTPGQRFEVIIIPTKKGRHRILNDHKVVGEVLGTIATNNLMSSAVLGTIPLLKASKTRTIKIIGAGMMDMGGMGMGGEAGGHEQTFTFDSKSFDPKVINQRVQAGVVEDWIIENTSSMHHPFHIHAWDFQVIDRGDGRAEAGWKDTINVPAHRSVRIRINFADFKGTTVYHCHILDHEDAGMMGIVQVA